MKVIFKLWMEASELQFSGLSQSASAAAFEVGCGRTYGKTWRGWRRGSVGWSPGLMRWRSSLGGYDSNGAKSNAKACWC